MRNLFSLGLVLAATGTFLAAQHGDDHPAATTFVGALAKAPGGAKIGVVIEGEHFLAYVCSDDDAFNATHARWFRGMVGKPGILKAESGGVNLSAKLAGGKVTGSVTGADKSPLAFTAAEASAGGVFRAEVIDGTDHYIVGWVRADDGATAGAAIRGKGKPAPLVQQKSPRATAPPQGVVSKKKVTGTQIDNLGVPLPGQILRGTLAGIDAKRNQIIVKTADGKLLSLSGDNFISTDAKGKRTQENLGTPTPFLKIGGFFELTCDCVETTTKKGGTTTKSRKCSINIRFGAATT